MDSGGVGFAGRGGYLIKCVEQSIQGAFFPGGGANDRNPQAAGKKRKIQPDFFAPGLIHQVDADNDPGGYFHGLQDQIHIPFKAGGVADYHNSVRFSKTDKVSGNLFFGRMSHQ